MITDEQRALLITAAFPLNDVIRLLGQPGRCEIQYQHDRAHRVYPAVTLHFAGEHVTREWSSLDFPLWHCTDLSSEYDILTVTWQRTEPLPIADESRDTSDKIVPIGWHDTPEQQAERKRIAGLDVKPGRYIYHCYHYGKHHSDEYDTLDDALHAAYGGYDSGEEFGLLIAQDGEIVIDMPDLIGAAVALCEPDFFDWMDSYGDNED